MLIQQSKSLVEALLVLPLLKTLDNYYPDFTHWYKNSVLPGVILGSDILLLAKDRQKVVGVSLAKRNHHETKLRCVRILPQYQNTGLGIKLIDKTLDLIECDKPYCTVSEELLHAYSRMFINRYGFELSEVNKGLYRPRKLEYHFNG